MRVIHAVPYDKGWRAGKTHKIRMFHAARAGRRFVEEDANLNRLGAALEHVAARVGDGAAGIEDVVDEQDFTAFDGDFNIAQKLYVA